MRDIHASSITNAVKKLCMEAHYSLEPDMLRAFDRALGTERSPAGQRVLQILKDTAHLARTRELPYCQDTGTAICSEAIRRLEAEGFPAMVINDCHGGDLYLDGMKQYARD
jgi:tartrate dehydratase alpha subunit/fumarate hydratase class I-like protein